MSWQSPFLSQAGRNTLIKNVTSSIPIYNKSVLKLSSKINDTINKLFRIFFWGNSFEKKKRNCTLLNGMRFVILSMMGAWAFVKWLKITWLSYLKLLEDVYPMKNF